MTTYKLVIGGVVRLPDYASIPENGADWAQYLAWVALGNTPEAADPPTPPNPAEVAQTGVKAWFDGHPSAALLVNLSIADLDTEIDNLVDALFPLASVANRNKEKLWRKTVSHAIRALAKREGFT